MPLKRLLQNWTVFVVCAVAIFAVLLGLDMRLKSATGFGTIDLLDVHSSLDAKRIFAAWIDRSDAAAAGFNLGFGYLFMIVYAYAFYYSGILAREAFAPDKGTYRRVLNYLVLAPVIGAVADGVDNAIALIMINTQPTDVLAHIAARASDIKKLGFVVGLLLLAAALPAYIKLKRALNVKKPSQSH